MEKQKLDDFSYFEVMDRAYVVLDHFNSYVREHPVVLANPELDKKAEEITDILYSFYSLAAVYDDEELAQGEGIERAKEYIYDEETKG